MAFAPDVFVFPGGGLDKADAAPDLAQRCDLTGAEAAARLGGSIAPATALAFHVAAIRELFEEAGVLLGGARPGAAARAGDVAQARSAVVAGRTSFGEVIERLDARLAVSSLVPLSRWVTPPIMARRFDARFFGAVLPDGAAVSFEGDEVTDHAWSTPRAALDGLADGSVRMWQPTASNLGRIAWLTDVDRLAGLAQGVGGQPEVSWVAPDIAQVAQPSGAGVDGLEVNAYLVGGSEVVVVDAGDPSEEALLAIVEAATAADATAVAVALTSADPDHAGGAEHIREGLDVLVYGGRGRDDSAGRWLPFPVEPLADGDRVPAGDVRVVVVAAPGPRPDHLAYWVPSSRTAIVGDLVGDLPDTMARWPPDPGSWRGSLARVRALEPARLLPAHGAPIEGVAAVSAALEEAEARLSGG
jgi:glyoxylase-like metal-dependent hydrolase (beta-lactamase superfamily II)/8-oxo-dGTP pyrophosphatase MutT (NUDIX family)